MEDIDLGNFLFWAISLYLAFKLGEIMAITKLGKALLEGLEENGVTVNRNEDGSIDFSLDQDETLLVVERVDKQYFAYSDAGEFIGQGVTFKDLFQSIKDLHPNKNFRVGKDQKSLTTAEVDEMIKSIFEVFNKETTNGEARK